MTVPAASRARPSAFAGAALALTFAGWLWFVVCFTSRVPAWWNSLGLFAALYISAILLAVRGIRSWLGIVALIIAGLSLGFVTLLLGGFYDIFF
jgi:hypothetical protein